MGFLRNNNNKVTVNCKKNFENDLRFTLVDNYSGVALDFKRSIDILDYFMEDELSPVKFYVNRLVGKKLNEEMEKRKWRTYTFFVKKSEAPYIINRIDSSEHVKDWRIHGDDRFESEGMVMITYEADKQILRQEVDGVVIEL